MVAPKKKKNTETYQSSVIRLLLLQHVFNNMLLINENHYAFKMKDTLKYIQNDIENGIENILTSSYIQIFKSLQIHLQFFFNKAQQK